MSARLDSLRERIAELDREILGLVAARMQTAREIGALKKQDGVPLRDWEVERRVLARAAEHSATLGLAPQLARGVMQLMIAESRAAQEQHSYSAYAGDAEHVLIVGGLGRMGRWLRDFLRNQGHVVELCDTRPAGIDDEPLVAPADGLRRASVAVVAVSLEATPAAIDAIAAAGFRGVVFDIASLKSHLKPAIERARRCGVSVTSIHPMFGPSARTLSDKVICVCDCGDAAATAKAEGFFRDTAARLVRLSLDEHDHVAAYVLGLSHLVNILFVRVLADSGDPIEHFREVSSTTFASQVATAATVIRESAELYYAIQKLNPFTSKVYESLRHCTDELTRQVLSGDRTSFIMSMGAGRAWMGEHDAH